MNELKRIAQCIKQDDLDHFCELISLDIDLNGRMDDEENYLLILVLQNPSKGEYAKSLLTKRLKYISQSMLLAVMHDDEEIINSITDLLLRNYRFGGGDLHIVKRDMVMALYYSVDSMQNKKVMQLIYACRDVHYLKEFKAIAFLRAFEHDNVELMKLLIAENPSKAFLSSMWQTEYIGKNYEAISTAIDRGVMYVKLLIDAGLDVNCLNQELFSVLHYAIEKGNAEVVNLIISSGFHIYYRPELSFLNLAIRLNKIEIAKDLIKTGIDICDEKYESTIWMAIELGNPELIELLISIGSKNENLNVRKRFINSGLNKAVQIGDIKMIDRFIEFGKDIISYDMDRLLISADDLSTVKHLIELGANINAIGYDGLSALCWAVRLQQNDIVEYLVANGADPNQGAITAYDTAFQLGDSRIISLIEDALTRKNITDSKA